MRPEAAPSRRDRAANAVVAVHRFDDPQSYLRQLTEASAAELATGPVPVLAGPALARFAGWCARHGVELREQPEAGSAGPVPLARYFRPDAAVHTLLGDPAAPLGRLLAARTGRPVHPARSVGAVRAAGATQSTVLCSLDRVEDAELAEGAGGRCTGVLTARDLATLATLVLRLLVLAPRFTGRAASVDPARAATGAMPGQVVSPDWRSVRVAGAEHVDLLALSGHGRECLLYLDGGVICGRSTLAGAGAVRVAAGPLGATSCQSGGGCYREHLSGQMVVPASELEASVVVFNSCAGLRTGQAQFSSEVMIGLSFLDGVAVACVGAPSQRSGAPFVGSLVDALLRAGHSLGEAVALANQCLLAGRRALGLFGLVGDAGLVPFPDGREQHAQLASGGPTVLQPAAALLRVRLPSPAGPGQVVADPADRAVRVIPAGSREVLVLPAAASSRQPATVVLTMLPVAPAQLLAEDLGPTYQALRLAELFGLDVPADRLDRLDALLSRANALLGADITAAEAGRRCRQALTTAAVEASEVQDAILRRWLDQTVHDRFQLDASYVDQCEVAGSAQRECPACGAGSLLEHRLIHGVQAAVVRRFAACLSCGSSIEEPWQSEVRLRLDGPLHASPGDAVCWRAELSSSARLPVAVHLGLGLLDEALYRGAVAQLRTVVVPAGGRTMVELPGRLPVEFDMLDRHKVRLHALARGTPHLLTRQLWVASRR